MIASRDPGKADSPVAENITGRGTLFELFRRDEAIRRLDAVLSELQTNDRILRYIIDIAKKGGSRSEIPTHRLGYSATELLITNRYVDENYEFFTLAENYYREAIAINDQLNHWVNNPRTTAMWILNETEKKRGPDPLFGEDFDVRRVVPQFRGQGTEKLARIT